MQPGKAIDVDWEVEAVLAWHDEDPKAAIATLLEDIRHLREQLALADRALSRGMVRGWRPQPSRRHHELKPLPHSKTELTSS
ncbi:hypothetical protein DTW90_11205 [Neorhizobium sp. P12A]|jgi:hypothetical protein|uniref:hypothetical protein n=1 Tax=Rhizobium/Agrobacterium group TaxID=227290 RepID=UPI0010454004|nr:MULTISPECIES: hypothetical protein [Rhizobium/Agrobacterium group]KAA0699877.1 hypothetical protein DTW90_11205 [Neorhizobium sp. P12A]TCR93280.1 hypothetical protein EV561_101726 [Rhizobium sp. BK376]